MSVGGGGVALDIGVLLGFGVEDCPGLTFSVGVGEGPGVWATTVGVAVTIISQLSVVWHLEHWPRG